MPIILLEKMASGLPIACSNLGPMQEVLNKGGLFFNPEDPNDIAKVVKKYLESSELRNKMSNISHNLASKYSWSRCANDTFSFIIDIGNK